MARPVLRVKGYQPEQIKALFRKDERYTIGIRLYAIYQVSMGQPSRKLEELYNTSFKQITNWVHLFETGGIDGLRDKEGRGRKSKLDASQLTRIKGLLLKESPADQGFNTATWTGPILIQWIKKQYGFEYKKAQIYNIIKSLDLVIKRGRSFSPRQISRSRKPLKKD